MTIKRRINKMASLINRKETKRVLLMLAHEHERSSLHRFERVSKEALDKLEARHIEAIKSLVDDQHKGVTIR